MKGPTACTEDFAITGRRPVDPGSLRTAGSIGVGLLLAGALAAAPPLPVRTYGAQSCVYRVVARDELVEAMRRVHGYDIAATTNAPRLGADVFLDLAATAAAEDRNELLLVRQADWFMAFLEVTGLTIEKAPIGARLAWEHGQDMLIDYLREHVIDSVEAGAPPVAALAVRVAWPDSPGSPRDYSYEDTMSVPRMRVTSKRVVRYRLLDYDDVVVYDRMEGLSGRPTTGLLGVLFSILGDANVLQSRIATSPDGFQVMRARARKGFISSTSVATFAPDGKGDKGIPSDRPDLKALEPVLERSFRIRYRPFRCGEIVGAS